MKKPLDEHAARFDEFAAEYDAEKSDEYKAAVELVVEHARRRLAPDDLVLDLGTGTGAIALRLAEDASQVLGRDISEGMMAKAREKASDRGIENVELAAGTFREPNVDEDVDLVVSNFAMHHLSDAEKRDAIDVLDELDPRTIVLGDVMLFGEADPSEPFYDPAVDDPATAGVLVDAFTDAGFVVTAAQPVHDQVGVIVAERPAAVEEVAGD